MGDTREIWFIHDGFLYEVTTYKELDSWLAPIMQTCYFTPNVDYSLVYLILGLIGDALKGQKVHGERIAWQKSCISYLGKMERRNFRTVKR